MAVKVLSLDSQRQLEILLPDEINSGKALVILAHGAGNDMNSPFLTTIANGIRNNEINVVRFNFPYKVAGKPLPDRSEILENSWRLVISFVIQNLSHNGLYIGGKSMGGRIASMVAADIPQIRGLVFLGYPLHPPGKFEEIRDEYLFSLQIPMLFIQGTRDAFARMDLLQNTLNSLRNRATLHWIEGGDHSYKVLVRQADMSYPETLNYVAGLISLWIREVQKE